MTEIQALHKIQTLAEAKIRINAEFIGLTKLHRDKETVEALYNYVTGDGEDPYKTLIKTRDNKLEKVEIDIEDVLKSVR